MYFERDTRFYPQNLVSPGFDSTFGAEIGDPTFNSQTVYGTPAPDTPFYGTINVKERQFALFGEATYPILPKLDLTLGARYFDFKDDFNLFFTGIAGAIAPGEPDTGIGEQKSKGVNPRGVLSYHVTDQVMVFGEAARGFRYGGSTSRYRRHSAATQLAGIGLRVAQSFGPDHLWSYTFGERGHLPTAALVMNVDGFYIDWTDVQTAISAVRIQLYGNAGKVKSQGSSWNRRFARPVH